MKKVFIYLTIFWGLSLILTGAVILQGETLDENYKININRIQSRLNENPENGEKNIESLRAEELGSITEVKIIDYENSSSAQRDIFFSQPGLEETRYIYKQIPESGYLTRYAVQISKGNKLAEFIYLALIITLIFIALSIFVYYIYSNTLDPLKEMADVPEKLAAGYVEDLDIKHSNQYLQKFFWGLDMLKEQLEEEKKRNYQLEKDRKTLVAGLSHDIRTPLSSIKNYAIALKEGIYKDESDRDRALDVIIEKTDMIDRLSKELLESSIKELSAEKIEVEPEEIYLNEISERLDKMISQKTELLHIDYKKDIPAENLLLKADLDALTQVFDNVIENAVKYGDLQFIKLKYQQEDYYQLISIENSGPQIAEAELKHIFSSYYRGSNVGDQSGFGLGLYISRKIMRMMEGDIYAENTDQGVKFVIVIRMVV